MSWSAETRCLYCDGKLPLFRKLTSGQFCSAAHAKAYWKEQERLAVERLHQTHDSLHAYRPPGALEAILGPAAANNPYYKDGELDADQVPATPLESAFDATERIPAAVPAVSSYIEEVARRASNVDAVASPGFHPYQPPNAAWWRDPVALPKLAEASWAPLTPVMPTCAVPALRTSVAMASSLSSVYLRISPENAPTALRLRDVAESVSPNAPKFDPQVIFIANPVTPELLMPLPVDEVFQEDVVLKENDTFEEIVPEPSPEETPAESPVMFVEEQSALTEPGVASIQTEEVLAEIAELNAIAELPSPADSPLVVVTAPSGTVEVAPFEVVVVEDALEDVPPMAPLMAMAKIGSLNVAPHQPLPKACLPSNVPMRGARLDLSKFEATDQDQVASAREASWVSASLDGAKMAPLPRFAPADVYATLRSDIQPAETKSSVDLTAVKMAGSPLEVHGPAMAWLVAHPLRVEQWLQRVPAPSFLRLQPQPAALGSGLNAPAYSLHPDECPLRWRFASGIRYPVVARNQQFSVAGGRGIQPLVADALPLEMPCDTAVPVSEPSSAWLMRLPFEMRNPRPAPVFVADQRSVVRVDATGSEPKAPASRLTAVQGTLEPQSRFAFLAAAARNAAGGLEPKFAWTHAVDFWKNAPRDLKLLVFAIPTLLALALHPSLPKFRVTPPANAAAQAPSGLNSAMRAQLLNVRQTVASRAGVELTEDFRAGLDSWQSRGDLSAAWSFDSNGFVRPGMLALYQPSLNLQDYEMNFLGLIDKKALSFVVRAQDFDNYYVIKLMILKPGPLPTVGVTRYAVIDGKPQERKDVIAPINARPDMLYRVSLNIHDDTYLLQMQGKIVDSWSEARLTHGGVGFFSASGEESRLRWVQVTHQYDMLGRLCAYLAPYNMPTKNGSW